MEKEHEEIYQVNPLEILTNEYFRLQRLQEGGSGGKPMEVSILLEETWDKITDIIHNQDREKLKGLRTRISDIIKEENKLSHIDMSGSDPTNQ